jgi:hypothetical protein
VLPTPEPNQVREVLLLERDPQQVEDLVFIVLGIGPELYSLCNGQESSLATRALDGFE